jgi:hypothetical protein
VSVDEVAHALLGPDDSNTDPDSSFEDVGEGMFMHYPPTVHHTDDSKSFLLLVRL